MIVCPFAKLNFSVQPLIVVVPVFVIARVAPKPPDHWFVTVYTTLHELPLTEVAVGVGVVLRVGVAVGVVPRVGVAVGVGVLPLPGCKTTVVSE